MDCGYVARNHMYNGTTYVHIYVGTTMYIRKYCELMQEVFPKGEQS